MRPTTSKLARLAAPVAAAMVCGCLSIMAHEDGAPAVVAPIIIDNTDPGCSLSPGWTESVRDPHYGSNYVYGRTVERTNARLTATWTPNIKVAGVYEVFIRWPASRPTDRASNAPYLVTYAGGKTKTVIVNQKQIELANKWYSLGEFRFDAGTGGNVMLSNDGTDHSVSADAVKWVYKAR